jgi:hypothetical protein
MLRGHLLTGGSLRWPRMTMKMNSMSLIARQPMSLGVRPVLQFGRILLGTTGTVAAYGAYKATGKLALKFIVNIMMLI